MSDTNKQIEILENIAMLSESLRVVLIKSGDGILNLFDEVVKRTKLEIEINKVEDSYAKEGGKRSLEKMKQDKKERGSNKKEFKNINDNLLTKYSIIVQHFSDIKGEISTLSDLYDDYFKEVGIIDS